MVYLNRVKLKFCAVCVKEYPKNSLCLGRFIIEKGEPPNHVEDCKSKEDFEKWKRTPDLFGGRHEWSVRDALQRQSR